MLDIPDIDFPVTKNPACSLFVQTVHSSLRDVFAQPAQQDFAFVVVQELGCFWPINDEEFCKARYKNRDESFDDENPAPAFISTDTRHTSQCICKKLRNELAGVCTADFER